MSTQKIGIEAARPILGDLADQADRDGKVTILTRTGVSVAAVVPLSLVPAETTAEKWVAYDATSGDVLADGSELQVRAYSEGEQTIIAASEAEWQRAAKVIAKRMSGNPPRRNPAGIEHL
jgi:hypothetical protein